MHRNSHRNLIVWLGFSIWLGADALMCGTFIPRQLGPEAQTPRLTDPSAIVHVAPANTPDAAAKVALANR